MARAVAQTLEGPGDSDSLPEQAGMLAVEAETGIGKTLAYLIPAVIGGRKVVVSTGTLNLQEQIINKEIPLIQQHIKADLKVVCVKGRRNYACLFRAKQFLTSPQLLLFKRSEELESLSEWLAHTRLGERTELSWLGDDSPLWEQICSNTAKCLGSRCPDNAACFIGRLRKTAAQAQIIIVNHHLFFSDLAIRRFGHAEVLPRYQTVIFDEAHHLENVATNYFGTSISLYQIKELNNDIEELSAGLPEKSRLKTKQISRSLMAQAAEFAAIFPARPGRYPLEEITRHKSWAGELNSLFDAFDTLGRHLESLIIQNPAWESHQRRCHDLSNSLGLVCMDMETSSVYWYERRKRNLILTSSPIEVADELRKHLYSQVSNLIFTSATLTTGGKFAYMFKRLGLDEETETLRLASPFDYAGRTRLYIPASGFPEPREAAYGPAVREQFLKLIKAAGGRTLLLFTSLSAMREAREFLSTVLPYELLMQGEAPKAVLLDKFQRRTTSVLLAVASFWEGVNVPGESLSCVIIDKLPFEVPSDPVIMARVNRINEEGGRPFFDLQIPRATLTLRQGLGRLMRSGSDGGLLAVLDIRLYSKPYGRIFRDSLPASPVIRDLKAVEEWFAGNHKIVSAP
ncbi:ATP-dependent DNA helicase [Desulfobacterota bacterium M19]